MLFGSALVLSGGSGSRMNGIEKGLLTLHGESLASRLAAALRPRFGELLLSTRRPELYAGLPFRCVADRFDGLGPLAGLLAGLEAATSEWVFVIAGDMPRFSAAYAERMMREIEASAGSARRPVACVTESGPHLEPFHAFYSRALVPRLEFLLAEAAGSPRGPSFSRALERAPVLRIAEAEARAFSSDWSLFASLNTPADFKSATDLRSATDQAAATGLPSTAAPSAEGAPVPAP